MSELLTTYGVLPPCYRTHLTVKLPACIPPPIELEQGLFTLLLSGPTTQRHEDKESRVSSKNSEIVWLLFIWYLRTCKSLRVKLDVNVSSQMWFIIAADLKNKKKEKGSNETKCVFFNGNNLIIHPVNVPQQSRLRLVKLSLTSVFILTL